MGQWNIGPVLLVLLQDTLALYSWPSGPTPTRTCCWYYCRTHLLRIVDPRDLLRPGPVTGIIAGHTCSVQSTLGTYSDQARDPTLLLSTHWTGALQGLGGLYMSSAGAWVLDKSSAKTRGLYKSSASTLGTGQELCRDLGDCVIALQGLGGLNRSSAKTWGTGQELFKDLGDWTGALQGLRD